MIPDMDSIYGPFLKLIMVDARDVGNGAYPAQHAQAVVKYITDIYEYHAAQGKSTKDILQDFVVHVNRRYGLVMRSEISKYIEEQFKYTSETNTYPDDERVDYDLLG